MKRTITMMFVAFLVVLNLNAQNKRPDHKSKSDLILGKKRSSTNLPTDDKSIKRQKAVQSIYKQKRTGGETIKLDSIVTYYEGMADDKAIFEHYLENGNYVIKATWYEYEEETDVYYGEETHYTTFNSDGDIIRDETHSFIYEYDEDTDTEIFIGVFRDYKYEYEYDNNGNIIKEFYYMIDDNDVDWELLEEIDIEYNSSNEPTKAFSIEYDEDEDDFVNSFEMFFFYDENNLLTSIDEYYFDPEHNYEKYLYTTTKMFYDDANQLIQEETHLIELRDHAVTVVYQNYGDFEEEYEDLSSTEEDSDYMVLVSSIEYSYNNGNIYQETRIIYSYTLDQDILYEKNQLEQYILESKKIYSKYIYSYEHDSHGNITYLKEETYTSDIFEDGIFLTSGIELYYEFDTSYLISDLMLSDEMYFWLDGYYNKHIKTKEITASTYIKDIDFWIDLDEETIYYYSESEVLSTQNTNTTASKFNAFPNPTSDKITFSGLTSGAVVNIYDMTGVLVLSKTVAQNEAVLVSDLAKGIYIATSISGNKQETTRFVVE